MGVMSFPKVYLLDLSIFLSLFNKYFCEDFVESKGNLKILIWCILGKRGVGKSLVAHQSFYLLKKHTVTSDFWSNEPSNDILGSLIQYDQPWGKKQRKIKSRPCSFCWQKIMQESQFLYIGAWNLIISIVQEAEPDCMTFVKIS